MTRKVLSSLTLLLIPSVCHGLVTTCKQLKDAFALTSTQNVEVEMHPFQTIECATFTNMTMSKNTLTVRSSENVDDFFGSGTLKGVRLEVTNGAKLTWETSVLFAGVEGADGNILDGGAVYVGQGSTVRFLNDLSMTDITIRNVKDLGSDYASRLRYGGCVWTAGSFRVDGKATFTRCKNQGAGDNPVGDGGAVYVAETGSVRFTQGVDISETFITYGDGAKGGGIYNLGTVNIRGNSRFENLGASYGAGIYNGEGAVLNFRIGAKALFRDVFDNDGRGSALYNLGYFKFSGPALFVDAEAPVIQAGDDSTTILSEDSAFWSLEGDDSEALFISDDADFTIPSSVTFVGYESQ